MSASPADARAYALRLLSYRSRSRKEMTERLANRGFDEGEVRHVISHLDSKGLLDDEKLASDLFQWGAERKLLGRKGLAAFLARRGIERGLIQRTLAARTESQEEAAAQKAVEGRLKSLKAFSSPVVKRRLWGMLSRRGFSPGVIKRVLERLNV